MTEVAGLLSHSDENQEDTAISTIQSVWWEVYKVHNLWTADNGIWEEESHKEDINIAQGEDIFNYPTGKVRSFLAGIIF